MSRRVKGCVRQLARGDEGSQLVEMCLSLLVLIALLMGTMEFSMAFLAYNEVTDAAREAARWAMVRGSTAHANTPGLTHYNASSDDIQTYVRSMNLPLLVSSNITVTATWLKATTTTVNNKSTTTWSACPPSTGCTNDPGNEVQVQVSYTLPVIVRFWSSTSNSFRATRSTWAISNTATMVISQ